MLIQLIKEFFLTLFWREAELKGWKLIWKPKTKPGFVTALVGASWILTIALLVVSIPHSVEIIYEHERGPLEYRLLKATLLAVAIEVVPALLVLTALHTRHLESHEQYALFGMAAPFLALTIHAQWRYYGQSSAWILQDWELALVLPGGALVGAVLIAFLLPHSAAEKQAESYSLHPVHTQFQTQTQAHADVAHLVELHALISQLTGKVELLSQNVTEVAADLGQRVSEIAADTTLETKAPLNSDNTKQATQFSKTIKSAELGDTLSEADYPQILAELPSEKSATGEVTRQAAFAIPPQVFAGQTAPQNLSQNYLRATRNYSYGSPAADGGNILEFPQEDKSAVALTIADLLGGELIGRTQLIADTTFAEAAYVLTGSANIFADIPIADSIEPAVKPNPQSSPQKLPAPEIDLNSLPDSERNTWCYRLRMSGWSYSAIGKLLSKSENTARGYTKAHAEKYGLNLK